MELTEKSDEEAPTHATENASAPKSRKRRNPFNLQRLKEEKELRQKKKARLIVRNISYKVTEELMRKHFGQWGTLEEVNLLKRADGRLVGCAFLQYENVQQSATAIEKGNNQPLLGRVVRIDWAVSKDEYTGKKKDAEEEKKPKIEMKEEEDAADLGEDDEEGDEDSSIKSEEENSEDEEAEHESADEGSVKQESDDEDSVEQESDDEDKQESDDEGSIKQESDEEDENASTDDDDDKKDFKGKLKIDKVDKQKHISNDVKEGCTIFIRNVHFDAEDAELRKVCRKFGPLYYAIINRERVSGHSKGTAFVKFKTKESADLCLQAGTEFVFMDQVLEPFPALSREEIQQQAHEKKGDDNKDSRNLYLAREGLIMSGSKAADDVSASDMTKRHKLEQIKTQVLKNLNRFVSRNRLSVHNLPVSYDNDKLKQMVITHTGYKPHECRVMRENKITPEHPQGQSKGFGFMSFNTHQEALTALRKLNNNPKIFGTIHRPIVAFSIEDRAVHKIKEKRKIKSKQNNPTFKEKLERRKEQRQQKLAGRTKKLPKGPQSDNKQKLKKHIEKLEESRAAKAQAASAPKQPVAEEATYVGTAAKRGDTITRMRSNKKIREQAQEHSKRVKTEKRKKKQQKIQQMHLSERRAVDRPKQGRKVERDDLSHLVNKYKRMLDSSANGTGSDVAKTAKKPKRAKWYKE